MRILFDLISTQPAGNSKYHGGSEYAKVVFEFLLKKNESHHRNQEVVAFFNEDMYLDKHIRDLINHYQIKYYNVKGKKDLQELLNTGQFDKFYSALPYEYYDLCLHNINFLYTIHGLRPLELPTDTFESKYQQNLISKLKFFYKTYFKNRYINMRKLQFDRLLMVTQNRKIIVPSYHTKFALLNHFPYLNNEQISVLYSPMKTEKSNIINEEDSLTELGVAKKNYYLLISGDRWIKNSYRAILAFDRLLSEQKEFQKKILVLGVNNESFFLKKLKNKKKFIFRGYIPEEELEVAYKNAFCFIYPTLNEGFGYPPLESMKYGVPVIASAITSIPEVCKDGVVYFNPYSIEEIMNRILYINNENSIRDELSKRGLEVYKNVREKQEEMLDNLIEMILT